HQHHTRYLERKCKAMKQRLPKGLGVANGPNLLGEARARDVLFHRATQYGVDEPAGKNDRQSQARSYLEALPAFRSCTGQLLILCVALYANLFRRRFS